MQEPKYYFAPSKLAIVNDVTKLGPASCPEIGGVYHAFIWSVAREDYFIRATATYKGNGIWVDQDTDQDVSLVFKWADYLVKQKK